MEGVGNIIYTQGDKYSIHAEGDSVLLGRTVVAFEDGTLHITQKRGTESKHGLNFYITSPTLQKVESAGVGTFEANEAVKFDNDFEFESEGVGSVKISDLTCQNFKFHQEGVGASNISIKCQDADISTEGVGACDIEIQANELKLSADGVGAVKVKGHVKKYDRMGGSIVSKISDKKLVVGE